MTFGEVIVGLLRFVASIFVVLFVVFLYFLPWFVAYMRYAKSVHGVIVLNMLLGWTFIGWVVALIWASIAEVCPPKPVSVKKADT